MDEIDRARRIKERERGELARQIFDNPLWDEAYTALVNERLERLLAPGTSDDEVLELRREILTANNLKQQLALALETGKMATIQIEEADQREARR
jgi:hypothetical protein